MDQAFLLAQIIGCLAMAISIASQQSKTARGIILMCIPSGSLWGVQYILLNAPMGALFNFCAAIKDLFLAYVPPKYVSLTIGSFLVILWITGLYLFNAWFDILPLLAGTIMNLALLKRDNRPLIARATILNQICWFFYNCIVGSWMGLICSLLVTTSAMIGMARFEVWELGKCFRTFPPSFIKSLFIIPNFRTYP